MVMRTTTKVLLPLLLSAPVGLALAGGDACRPPAPLVVHEWGTFTGMQGVDGFGLEGLHREEEALPRFVHDYQGACTLGHPEGKGLHAPPTRVTQKMETPVIYFHTSTPARVKVRVDFPRGLLSQWYPNTSEPVRRPSDLDLSKVESTSLAWDVELVPGQPPAEVPEVATDDPWHFAREVDAAWCRVQTKGDRDVPPGPTEAERYLFYRGLGAFTLPLVTSPGAKAGQVVTANAGAEAVPFAFGLQVDLARTTVRWAPLGAIPSGGAVTFDAGATAPKPLETGVAELQVAVQAQLEAQGLFADEARAMVRTWARSWFGSPGTRVLWLVPRARVDALLPLAIEPAPATLVRAFVGRLEVVTPEVEAELEAALLARRGAGEAKAAAEARLQACGRLLEPHLRAVLRRTKDAAVRESASELLARLVSPRGE
jgi:hypothetical protein